MRKFTGAMEQLIEIYAAEMTEACKIQKLTLKAQISAYDLLQYLSEEDVDIPHDEAQCLCQLYESYGSQLEALYDADSLKAEMDSELTPMKNQVNELRFEAAAAASLHEFAKEVWQTWQTAGVFARRRALRDLRDRAGFRLESHRIGNYVAKTYDLANEAQMKFGHAQQMLFAADVTYKCRPGVFRDIYDIAKSFIGV